MDAFFLDLLRCPFCAGTFKACEPDQLGGHAGYGLLSCHCDQYPVVGGIPILKKDPTGTLAQAVAMIKSGRGLQALLALISPPSPTLAQRWIRSLPLNNRIRILKRLAHERILAKWQQQIVDLLHEQHGSVTACDLIDFYFPSEDVRNYFGYRFSTGRYLEGLSLTASLIRDPSRPVLDLACGCGHNTWGLLQQVSSQPVIGLDNFLFPLYVAKHWVAPQAHYVCCEGDISLPFPDGAFSTAFCSDALHYFASKVGTVQELKRLTRDDGIIVLHWLRNALVKHPRAGSPLPPGAYQTLVADMPHRLISNRDVRDRYVNREGPALARSADIHQLNDEPVVSVVASNCEDALIDYGPFPDWPHARGSLKLNPLFVQERRQESVTLRRTFPSRFWEENSECQSYLPETVDVRSEVLRNLASGERTAEVERLIEQSVLLSLPERYGSLNDPTKRSKARVLGHALGGASLWHDWPALNSSLASFLEVLPTPLTG